MRVSFILMCIFLGLCGQVNAADPQPYKVEFASVDDGEINATLKATSDLQALRASAPVSPFGLIARARSDMDRLKTVLESFGYYESRIVIKINGLPLTDPTLGDVLVALPKGDDALVSISFVLGTLYHLRRIDIEGDLPESFAAQEAMGLKTGQPAVAAEVLAGGARLLTALQEQGYALAQVDSPVAYEAADVPALDLRFKVASGRKYKIGAILVAGLKRVHESVVRRRLLLRTGDQYRPSAIEKARQDLLALTVFDQVSVQVGKDVDASGGVPITFRIRERRRHAVSGNTAYSSDLGLSGGITWTDRNVFGNAEQLTFAASVINLTGSDTTTVGYDTKVKYLIPDFLARDQTLLLTVGALKQSLEAYDQNSKSASAVLSRKLSSVWSVSAGVSTSNEHVSQEGEIHDYTLVALPLTVGYDSTNLVSPLLDPLHGLRGTMSVTPTLAIGTPNTTFYITQMTVAGFFDLNNLLAIGPGRSVLAARVLAGVALGAGEFSLPPDQRFYAGGSGTVRGYRYQSVGPQFADGNPSGGTKIFSTGLELRQRFGRNFGAAFFIDGGYVSYVNNGLTPATSNVASDGFQVGAGAGIRYYTPIGPIRFDVAVPVNPRPTDDKFVIYIGLGQAF
ncbi:MAG TPA: BamA/TamA family outer membrane protein [Steroidobacteraceae bacterium]